MSGKQNDQNKQGDSTGSVSKRWKIKRWILEEYEEFAPDRKTAIGQCCAEGNPTVIVTKQTCVEVK
jgi:hypothetical protein